MALEAKNLGVTLMLLSWGSLTSDSENLPRTRKFMYLVLHKNLVHISDLEKFTKCPLGFSEKAFFF